MEKEKKNLNQINWNARHIIKSSLYLFVNRQFFNVERLPKSLIDVRIYFLFLGKNTLVQLLELQALESYYVFSIFSFFLGQDKRTHIQQQKEWQRRKLQVCLW